MVKPGRKPRSPDGPITEKEWDVFVLLGAGLASKQIAAELELSPSAMGLRIASLLKKLKVNSRAQAALLYHGIDAAKCRALLDAWHAGRLKKTRG